MTASSPAAKRRRLGRLLRELREQAGLSGDEASAAVERSASWISRIESGRSGLRQRELRDLLSLYRLADPEQQAELELLADAGRQRAWWNDYADSLSAALLRYVGLEADATSIESFEDRMVPGLLQTEAYMRASASPAVPPPPTDVVEALIKVRMTRQRMLREPDSPQFTAIIDEAVLRREVGGPQVVREQLSYLLQAVDDGIVNLQILAFANQTQAQALHAFTIIRFEADPPVALVDTISGGFLEEGESVDRAYGTIFEHLKTVALDPESSRRIVQSALDGAS